MPNRRTLALAAALALAPLSLAHMSAASAQPASERGNLERNCMGDYLRLCAGTDPGGPEVEACFRRNMRNLSPGCRGAIGGYVRRNPGAGQPED